MVSQILFDSESDRLLFDGDPLFCGQCLDVLVYNGLSDSPEWVSTRVEYGSSGWYLVGLLGYTVHGLFARM